jgi:hypothetical protein
MVAQILESVGGSEEQSIHKNSLNITKELIGSLFMWFSVLRVEA